MQQVRPSLSPSRRSAALLGDCPEDGERERSKWRHDCGGDRTQFLAPGIGYHRIVEQVRDAHVESVGDRFDALEGGPLLAALEYPEVIGAQANRGREVGLAQSLGDPCGAHMCAKTCGKGRARHHLPPAEREVARICDHLKNARTIDKDGVCGSVGGDQTKGRPTCQPRKTRPSSASSGV